MADRKIVLTDEKIKERVRELGREISRDFRDRELLLIGVLNGAFIFMADLAREIDLPVQIDFIRVASYGSYSSPSATLSFTKDAELPLAGKHVLIVEDIIDTGRTLSHIKEHFTGQGAQSVSVCALIDKKERREAEVAADYVGFEVARGFLVGYGLDFAEKYRNLPQIYHLENPDD